MMELQWLLNMLSCELVMQFIFITAAEIQKQGVTSILFLILLLLYFFQFQSIGGVGCKLTSRGSISQFA